MFHFAICTFLPSPNFLCSSSHVRNPQIEVNSRNTFVTFAQKANVISRLFSSKLVTHLSKVANTGVPSTVGS